MSRICRVVTHWRVTAVGLTKLIGWAGVIAPAILIYVIRDRWMCEFRPAKDDRCLPAVDRLRPIYKTALRWQGFFGCLCNTGWCGHVSDLFVRHITPLAIMPSAYQVPTISSHSRCWVEMGSPDPAVQPACCINSRLPFTSSSARPEPRFVSNAVSLCRWPTRPPEWPADLDSVRRCSSAPKPFGLSCWRVR